MSLELERGAENQGFQILRLVIDTVDSCNLNCKYCHPNFGWTGQKLPLQTIKDIFHYSEKQGLLELTLTGGEITLHPNFVDIMNSTNLLDKTCVSFVTNATKITPEIVKSINDAKISRICVSLDGPNEEIHNYLRGNNFQTVLRGLNELKTTGKEITVISVANQHNVNSLLELSELLADKGLSSQHHICAVCYSGLAKEIYNQIGLTIEQFISLQKEIDEKYLDLKNRGLFVTFNSLWPAIGKRSLSTSPRNMTIVQLTEQIKNLHAIIRPNGDFRTSFSYWGREKITDDSIGNVILNPTQELFDIANKLYRKGLSFQLRRESEAEYKFNIKPDKVEENTPRWIPILDLSSIDALNNDISEQELSILAKDIINNPLEWRLVLHSSGIKILFNKKTSLVTLLKPEEGSKLISKLTVNVN